jgi:hypothetical protein
MRCHDMVMHAMSYHPRHRRSKPARLFWEFVADWQAGDGGLHRRAGHWNMIELASRFDFACVRRILQKSLGYATRHQRRDGGLDAIDPSGSACRAVLAYGRQGLLKDLLSALPRDPLPLVLSAETPLGIKTRREALNEAGAHAAANPDSGAKVLRPRRRLPRTGAMRSTDTCGVDLAPVQDKALAARLARQIHRDQDRNGSWHGLITATADAIEDLLDCGVAPGDAAIRKACEWLARQQRCPDDNVFDGVPTTPPHGMFYVADLKGEFAHLARHHPDFPDSGGTTCLTLLPIYQTAAAVAALCRAGQVESPAVRAGFSALLTLRGPGYTRQPRYTDFWCACSARIWVDKDVVRFDKRVD